MKFLIIMIMSLALLSCDISSPEEAAEANLRTALDAIVLAFNMDHLDEIMEYYSEDYIHNGDDKDDVELDWNIRLNDYQELELENIAIDLGEGEAIISFNRRFFLNGVMVDVIVDPSENGDMSYWELEFDQWKIVGNGKSGW